MGSSGGGGSSGLVEYHADIQDRHNAWLDQMAVLTDDVIDGTTVNPYSIAYTHNPEDDFTGVDDQANRYLRLLVNYEPETSYRRAFEVSEDLITTSSYLSESSLNSLVDNFEEDESATYQRSIDSFSAGMADINAVQSTAFVVGLANLEAQFERGVSKFRTRLQLEYEAKRLQFTLQITQDIANADTNRISMYNQSSHYLGELTRVKSVLMREFLERDLDLSVKEVTFPMTVLQYAGNLLAAPAGGTVVSGADKPGNPVMSAVGGAMSGAATGAAMGSVVPGIGTAIGAVAGGLLGLGASFM